MPIPDFQSIMLPALELAAGRDTMRLKDAEPVLADEFNLSEEERQEKIPSQRQRRFYNRVSWAMGHLSYAGLLTKPATGIYQITEEGKKVLEEKPDRIDISFLERYPRYQEFRSGGGRTSRPEAKASEESEEETLSPDERIDLAHNELAAGLKQELLQRIHTASPEFFERLVLNLLVAMGYGGGSEDSWEHLGRTSDGGIDGVINEDKLGLDKIYIQAKRWDPNSRVGRPDVQSFVGSLAGKSANKGVFVTTSSFSSNVSEYVKTIQQSVILIDGDELARLMIEHDVGVRLHRAVRLKRVDEDFFQES